MDIQLYSLISKLVVHSPSHLPQIIIKMNKVFTAFQSANQIQENIGIIENKRSSLCLHSELLVLNEDSFNRKNGVPKKPLYLTKRILL